MPMNTSTTCANVTDEELKFPIYCVRHNVSNAVFANQPEISFCL